MILNRLNEKQKQGDKDNLNFHGPYLYVGAVRESSDLMPDRVADGFPGL